ncbi:MAG: recombinase family protein [Candidatus Andersenbacteria bacterium]|nr:recombinase family protein [Candidatus Andersenbacteria bacterium]MBI3251101.1 recombinase family protein [Candidatus Andersenbacteria bacterium]
MTNENQKQTRVALYCRTAARDKNTKESKAISQQVMALKKYAAKQGMKVVGVYVDNGCSGSTLDRPGLDKLRSVTKKGGIDALLTKHPDRLARNVLLLAQLMQEFQSEGVKVIFYDLPHYGPAERLMMSIVVSFRKFERQTRSERIKRGLRARKKIRREEQTL